MTGPPEFVEIPDRAALTSELEDMSPPYGVRFAQGGKVAREKVADIKADRGGEIAELHFDDGRYVIVNVKDELEGVHGA